MIFTRSIALAGLISIGALSCCCSAFVPSSSHASIGTSIAGRSAAAQKLAVATARRWMSAVAEEAETSQQSSSVQHADQCPDDDLECITKPRGATNPWEVHKFGGASLATAELYRTVGDLLIREARGRGEGSVPTMA